MAKRNAGKWKINTEHNYTRQRKKKFYFCDPISVIPFVYLLLFFTVRTVINFNSIIHYSPGGIWMDCYNQRSFLHRHFFWNVLLILLLRLLLLLFSFRFGYSVSIIHKSIKISFSMHNWNMCNFLICLPFNVLKGLLLLRLPTEIQFHLYCENDAMSHDNFCLFRSSVFLYTYICIHFLRPFEIILVI